MSERNLFFRVHHPDGLGLWYNKLGEFTNKVVDLNLNCADLDMSHDEECVGGYLSCVNSLELLFAWFSKEELAKLIAEGYKIVVFESNSYKVCNKYNHHLIEAATANQVAVIKLL